jgi:hypothetical protein
MTTVIQEGYENGSPFAKGSGVSEFRTWGRDAS